MFTDFRIITVYLHLRKNNVTRLKHPFTMSNMCQQITTIHIHTLSSVVLFVQLLNSTPVGPDVIQRNH